MENNAKTEEFRREWRARWLSSIDELTDIDLQEKKWLDFEERSPHYSFSEFMCCYFDDLNLKPFSNDKGYPSRIEDGFVSPNEWAIIESWNKKLGSYVKPKNSDADPHLILDDLEWINIVNEGRKSLKELLKIVPNIEFEEVTKYLNLEKINR